MSRRSRLPVPFATLSTPRSTLTFYQGDSLEIVRAIQAGSVDVVVTSPPYNLGVRYRTYEDTLPREDYLKWTRQWVRSVARTLSPEGSFFLNVGAKPTDPWAAMDVAQAARRHLTLQNTIHWIKSIAIDREVVGGATGLKRDLAVGHYKPINSKRFVNDCHEFVFHFTHEGTTTLERQAVGVPYQDKSNVKRWRAAAQDVRCRGNAWFMPYETIKSRERDRPHPATFPSRLPEQCLLLHGVERVQLVLDPFLGLGSTAVACARLGLNFVGIEVDEVYLAEAVARTKAAMARLPL
jgi:site-specific DNA-methyltransferase (adenine-specific)